jgi:hypothetical protein
VITRSTSSAKVDERTQGTKTDLSAAVIRLEYREEEVGI